MEATVSNTPHRYFIVYKPREMVSQFVSPHKIKLLGDLDFDFPEGTHAIGRLDINSEGLLLLTTNKKVTKLLFESDVKHKRSYLVQVRHMVTEETRQQLESGVLIRAKGGGDYTTKPCEVSIIEDPAGMLPAGYDIKEYSPSSWIMITLTEGKYRQVRKMVAAVKHQCKRLARVSIEDMNVQGLEPGRVVEIDEKTFFAKLKIDHYG
ncbi:MAG TPA: pseudouridine synthase [Segetibacter sp.]